MTLFLFLLVPNPVFGSNSRNVSSNRPKEQAPASAHSASTAPRSGLVGADKKAKKRTLRRTRTVHRSNRLSDISSAEPKSTSVMLDRSNVILPEIPTKQLSLRFHQGGTPLVEGLSALSIARESGSASALTYGTDEDRRRIYLTLDPGLQAEAQAILRRYRVPWGALVAIEPHSGRVKALAGYSHRDPGSGDSIVTRATFPAASLFKLVTAAAAIERGGISAHDVIRYRGGDYTLSQLNYLPDPSKDVRVMNFATAMGKSVNPVFARVALQSLSVPIIERYALNFGFNTPIPFDTPVDVSSFTRPEDNFSFARLAAGFGPVQISPLHAALITAAIANSGKMMRPFIVERILAPDGRLEYQARAASIRYPILSSTAQQLLAMMKMTVETGTARKHFASLRNSTLQGVEIAAKTGTLSGENPKGVYYWFVVAAPAEDPELSIAALVIDPGGARVRGTVLGKELLEYYFRSRSGEGAHLASAGMEESED